MGLLSVYATIYSSTHAGQAPSTPAKHSLFRQPAVGYAVQETPPFSDNPARISDTLLSFTQFSALSTLYSRTAIILNRRRHPHPHGSSGGLPCKTSCFTSFFTAHLAGFRHENRFSATKSARVSLIAAGSAHPCHRRHCRQGGNRRHACGASLSAYCRQQNRTTTTTSTTRVFVFTLPL
jgi:hypothetical protein